MGGLCGQLFGPRGFLAPHERALVSIPAHRAREHRTRVPIIISESTYEAAKDVLVVRRLGEVQVKGRARSVVAYELEGLRGGSSPGRRESVTDERDTGVGPDGGAGRAPGSDDGRVPVGIEGEAQA